MQGLVLLGLNTLAINSMHSFNYSDCITEFRRATKELNWIHPLTIHKGKVLIVMRMMYIPA